MKVNSKELTHLLQTTDPTLFDWFYLNVSDFAAEGKTSDWEQYVRRWVLLVNNVLLTSKHERGESLLIYIEIVSNFSNRSGKAKSQEQKYEGPKSYQISIGGYSKFY